LPTVANGHTNGASTKRKRDAEEADLAADIAAKRGKVVEGNGFHKDAVEDFVIVDGNGDGAIVIDD